MNCSTISALTDAIDLAVTEKGTERITAGVQAALESHVPGDQFSFDESFKQPCADTYGRRLLYRSPDREYVIVAMAWGPGHGTKIHDHGGNWCVEIVAEGQVEIVQYDLVKQENDRYYFEEQLRVCSGCGASGRLIPPFDYHTIQNTSDQVAISLHVYSQEIKECRLFDPAPEGHFTAKVKQLSFDSCD